MPEKPDNSPVHLFIRLENRQIRQLKVLAKNRYGKASVSLLAKKLLQEQIGQPERTDLPHQKPAAEHQRLTLRLPPQQQAYLSQKAALHRSSLNDVVRDIIAEHITAHPVLSNDAVQALYQSNYQLLRLGRNINQIARHFNAATPDSLTTETLNSIVAFLEHHTGQVGKVLREQGRRFKYRPIGAIHHEATESTD